MIIREKVRIGDQVVTLETGRIAKQAQGSCLVRAGDTIVLVTACGNQEAKVGQSFFPLSVDYQEKTYAAGKIPGGFFKREGRLRDYEILTSRLIDRPCRPLFPEGYLAEVQIVATVMSFDQENPPDVLALVGASAALHMSPMPWTGPIAGVRVGRVDGEFVANPTYAQMAESDCELLVAASRDAIVMVEGEADEMSEEDLVEALFFAHASIQDTLDLIERMREAVGKPKWTFAGDNTPVILKERVRQVALAGMREACSIANKATRGDAFKQLRREVVQLLSPEFPGQDDLLKGAYEDLRYQTMRGQVLDEGRRLDNRDTRTVRPISIELGVLPRTHGSSLFTRGETQAIVTSTLGTARDSQRLDTLSGDVHKRFMLHYNFPPYSVGEVKPMRGPGRREVGHGDLAERALAKVLPSKEEFPYAIRIVSEITESNGSSSMASVCGGALALMDAGVPIRAPVAGVAMGLIKEGERYAILTDILGDEDALGDMDFKVCGTDKGVTAIQMDIKIEGLSREILERALRQAREARLHILDKMQRALPAPREELSQYAPRITQIRVKPDQVRTIIGPGGKMIRAIVDQTGANIDVEDDGTVSVSSADSTAVLKALEIIKSLTTDPEIGDIYEGVVKRIEPYGAFLEIMPGKDGLCHISDIDWSHVTNVEDYMKLGDKVPVKLTNIDREGRIRLSRKDAIPEPTGASKLNGRASEPREELDRPRAERGARVRDERPAARARDFDREDRPGRGRDLDREREERVAKARDLDREERPAAKARDFDREERIVKPRDLDREERIVKPRDLDREERIVKPRDLDREERIVKPRDLDREERIAKPRDLDREERPARTRDLDEERVARGRTLDRPERAPKVRELDLDERAPKTRDFDREDRPAKLRDLEREERVAKPRDFDREERISKPRDLEREERVAKPRDLEREDRPAKLRDFDREERVAKPRDLEREDRPAKLRDLDREERVAKPRDLDARPARVRDLDAEPRTAAVRDDARELRAGRARGLDRDEPKAREERVKARDFEAERPLKPRDSIREERPLKPRDVERARPIRALDEEPRAERPGLDEREERGRGRAVERDRPLRDEAREFSRPRRDSDERALPRARDERVDLVGRELDDERPARIARDLPERGRRDLDARTSARPQAVEREDRPLRGGRELERDAGPRAARNGRDLDAPSRPRREVDERPARAELRDAEFEREPAVRGRREVDERPVGRARARDDERDVVRPRDDVRGVRRDVELDERPRARRDEDDRFEPRASSRPGSDRPARGRSAEVPSRGEKRTERVDEVAFTERAPVAGRERDDLLERDRPSRVRTRARNRDRVRELERERERD